MRFWGFGGIPSAGREVITYNERDMFDELGLGAAVLKGARRRKRSGVPFICWRCTRGVIRETREWQVWM
jgi:hypothetical protein